MFYVSLMVTPKQKPIDGTQKIKRKESIHITQRAIKSQRKGAREKSKYYKTARKKNLQNYSKSTPLNNFFKCKWTKFSQSKQGG